MEDPGSGPEQSPAKDSSFWPSLGLIPWSGPGTTSWPHVQTRPPTLILIFKGGFHQASLKVAKGLSDNSKRSQEKESQGC